MKFRKKVDLFFIFIFFMFFSVNSFAEELIKSNHIIKSGDNLITLLKNDYIDGSDIQKLIYNTKDLNYIENLNIGQKISIYKKRNGSLEKIILNLDNINVYVVEKINENFIIKKGRYRTDIVNKYTVGEVKTNINKTLNSMGLNESQKKEFKNMFGNKINLNNVKKGTLLTVSFPEHYIGNKKVLIGDLSVAEVSYRNDSVKVFSFNDYEGERSYYLENGEPVSEDIRRDPLAEYSRISSKFSSAREHPVFGDTKSHNGVDYAAKKGTPIYAASSGRIAVKEKKIGYGNVVVIDHPNGYSTLYAHMFKFKDDVYAGKSVLKGDVIGYVGSTGYSTGNHLHFEIRKNGVYLDPLTVQLPFGKKIARSDVSKFRENRNKFNDGLKLSKIIKESEGKNSIAIREK